MEQKYIQQIASELSIRPTQVTATLELLAAGGTIPFIARYRKEKTGELDEVQIAAVRDLSAGFEELEKRRAFILKSIKEQEKLTPELEKKIDAATTLTELEDIYLPYKPKRKTKATVAKDKGLEPLAKFLFDQNSSNVEGEAEKFLSEEKEVKSIEEALQGARDIIAEWVSEDAEARQKLRNVFEKSAIVKTKVLKGKEAEGEKYKDYFEWEEPLAKTPSHRLLAMRRGEKEMILSMDISPEKEVAIEKLERQFVKGNNAAANQVQLAIEDCYKRLLKPSLETEFRLTSKKKADLDAIRVFTDNLRELLLASPLGQKAVLALDPGFRTGCKVVCLNQQGKLLHNAAIYPHEPQRQTAAAEATLMQLVNEYKVEAIAIGNGTAGRETEAFVNKIKFDHPVQVVMVNESGASIYSASEIARDEFPDQDITVRGAVSIGRRLADPLAELVKLDPKSIGVGQYQHDVDQTALKNALDDVVMSCVNAVGVDVNTASKQLLTYVSGLGPTLAENIVNYRNENGPFQSRKELLKVPRMGEKVFEQAAGFLRIRDGKNPLDASAVHPERYKLVEQMAKDLQSDLKNIIGKSDIKSKIDLKKYVNDEVGLPTLQDILEELVKPGRDPRKEFEVFSFDDSVHDINDLREGMTLPGIVTNVTNFGAFVDIGVHQDGLVHISEISNTFVKDPNEVVKVSQKVQVRVTSVDVARKRIALSMKDEQPAITNKPVRQKNIVKKEEPQGSMQDKLAALKGKWG